MTERARSAFAHGTAVAASAVSRDRSDRAAARRARAVRRPRNPARAADADGHAETARPPRVPLLAGRYRLGSRVGSDTAAGAEFWRAEDTVLRRDVAATVLRRFGAGHRIRRRRGRRRAQEIIAQGAAVGQLRASRLRTAAGRARARRSRPAGRGAGRRRRRVGPRPQPRRGRRGRHAQAFGRGPRPAAAGGRRRSGAPARPRAGLRPSRSGSGSTTTAACSSVSRCHAPS